MWITSVLFRYRFGPSTFRSRFGPYLTFGSRFGSYLTFRSRFGSYLTFRSRYLDRTLFGVEPRQDGRYRYQKMGGICVEMYIAPTHVRCFPSSCLFVVRASSESHFSILLSFFSFCRPSAHKLRHDLSIIFRLTSDVVSCCPLSPIFLRDLLSS